MLLLNVLSCSRCCITCTYIRKVSHNVNILVVLPYTQGGLHNYGSYFNFARELTLLE